MRCNRGGYGRGIPVGTRIFSFLALFCWLLTQAGCVAITPEQVTGQKLLVSDATAAQSNIAPQSAPGVTEYQLRPGDEIDIKFYYNKDLNEKLRIGPDGRITLQLVGDMQAAGLSASELTQRLLEVYSKHKKNLEIAVVVRDFSSQQVYVGGEVIRPGSVVTFGNLSATHAIMAAGGFRDTAEASTVVVLRNGGENREPIFMTLNLKQGLEGSGYGDITLQPYDVVFVPKTPVARMNQYVRQYIADMLPIDLNVGYNWINGDRNN